MTEKSPISNRTDVQWPLCHTPWPNHAAIEARVEALLAKMSIAQKVGQMMQPEIQHITPAEVGSFHIGAVLNGGGSFPNNNKQASVSDWLTLADAYYRASMAADSDRLPIPVIWGADAVHGHNNVYGATIFPHNIGLGAAGDSELVLDIAKATAREVAATGIDWSFAPTLAVVQDLRWGRCYESYGCLPDTVADYASVMVNGLQGEGVEAFTRAEHVIATAKHFVGEGGTQKGIDQGDNVCSEETLRDIHAAGYFAALRAGVQTVMASFSSWQGSKIHGHYYLLTDVLKRQMGFDGFVVSDWNGFKQVEPSNHLGCGVAINAGVDMIMCPEDWRALIEITIEQIAAGEIAEERIDDAVRRILRVKMRVGAFDKGKPSERLGRQGEQLLGHREHRALARRAARESLVLLKNERRLLPLKPRQRVLVAGSGADNIGQQCGGWTLTWQGTMNQNKDFPEASSIWTGIRERVISAGGSVELEQSGKYSQRPDVAIVVFGELPYAEGEGDRTHLSHSADSNQDLCLLQSLKADGIPVVSVFLTGRPLWVNPEINLSQAFVVAWLPGSEGRGIADVLFLNPDGSQAYDFAGRLPLPWPDGAMQADWPAQSGEPASVFATGFGLSYKDDGEGPAAQNLTELDIVSARPRTDSLRIYVRRPIPPYELFVGEEGQWRQTVDAVQATSVQGAVEVKIVDNARQGDALAVKWRREGQIYFQSIQPQDFSGLQNSGAAIHFKLRVDSAPQGSVVLRMDSQYPASASFDLTESLCAQPREHWKDWQIPLSELAVNGLDYAQVRTPFLIWADAPCGLSFGEVYLQAGP